MLLKLMMQFLNGMLNMITMTKDELIELVNMYKFEIKEQNRVLLLYNKSQYKTLHIIAKEVNDFREKRIWELEARIAVLNQLYD